MRHIGKDNYNQSCMLRYMIHCLRQYLFLISSHLSFGFQALLACFKPKSRRRVPQSYLRLAARNHGENQKNKRNCTKV